MYTETIDHSEELQPTRKQKSFYRKAYVHYMPNGDIVLQSYDTMVARIENRQLIKMWDGYSATTMAHIQSFCDKFGIECGGKKWWMNLEPEMGNGARWACEGSNGFLIHRGSTVFDNIEDAEKECTRLTRRNPLWVWYPIEV